MVRPGAGRAAMPNEWADEGGLVDTDTDFGAEGIGPALRCTDEGGDMQKSAKAEQSLSRLWA